MRESSRRAVLAALAAVTGCSGTPSGTESTPATPGVETGTTRTDTPDTVRRTARNRTTSPETGVPFDDLSTDGMETRCLRFDYASYATTPVPSPTPAAPSDDARALELATAYERAYLRNWVVLNYEPIAETTTDTPDTPTPNPPTYPVITAKYADRAVLGRTDRGVVVGLRYERVLGGQQRPRESLGRYTVTYYLTADATARAETTGYERPGPHPTEKGVLLRCS